MIFFFISISALLQQRIKDMESRQEILEKTHKLETEKQTLSQNLEKYMMLKKNKENELLQAQAKIKDLEKQMKENS